MNKSMGSGVKHFLTSNDSLLKYVRPKFTKIYIAQ